MARTSMKLSQPGAPVDMTHMTPGLWYFEGDPVKDISGGTTFYLDIKVTNETNQTFLVARVRGRVPAECLANAQLLVNVSHAMHQAHAAKAEAMRAIPPPGSVIKALVDDPNGADLQTGEEATVVNDPDDGHVGEPNVWVEAGGAVWGLDPMTQGTDWEVVRGPAMEIVQP